MAAISLPCRANRLLGTSLGAFLLFAADVHAQRGSDGHRSRHLLEPQSFPELDAGVWTPRHEQLHAGARPAILVTGYWPPSNEAVRRFSNNPKRNPDGWIGSNWEGRGYDIYAFFPEFNPPNCDFCGKGHGDLEVDYQDTSADFWPMANSLQPIAILTLSRGWADLSWELEMNQINRSTWFADYVAPTQPTPAPPDSGWATNGTRTSTLPVEAIVADVAAANLGLDPFVCYNGNGGGFLSEFIAYHGVWYQDLHKDPMDPAWCVAAGHVHVGGVMSWNQAQRAAKTSLRALIRHVDQILDPSCHTVASYCVSSTNSVGPGAWISSTGSTSLSASDLALIATEAPPSVFGTFCYGALQRQTPWGNGKLCVGGPLFRVPPIFKTDVDGTAHLDLDYTQPPFSGGSGQVSPGSTWNFQFVYRDPLGAGERFNASNGLSVTFCP